MDHNVKNLTLKNNKEYINVNLVDLIKVILFKILLNYLSIKESSKMLYFIY